MLQIDDEEHDHRAGKQQPYGQQRRQAVQVERRKEDEPGHRLDDRIGRTDRRVTGPATAAQHQPADERNVLVPRERTVAGRAVRPRPVQRLPARQPVDADVEEASNQQPEHKKQDGRNRHYGVPSVGSGQSDEFLSIDTTPDP